MVASTFRVVGLAFLVAVPAAAQVYGSGVHGALAPTANLTLDTTANGGVFEFTSITIPAGVTVRLVGPNPAILLCRGPVTIAGTLDASGFDWSLQAPTTATAGGPGGYAGSYYGFGSGPGGGPPGYFSGGIFSAVPDGCMGSHATLGRPASSQLGAPAPSPAPTYGTALPFDLRGGSGGGGCAFITGSMGFPGTGGGGTVAILAEGAILISGALLARGGSSPGYGPSGGTGAGGSILLRTLHCLQVSGTIDATAGTFRNVGPGNYGAGFIRIDSYTACGAPDLTGATIQPPPLVAPLPFLTQLAPPRIGHVYPVRCASAPGDVLTFWFSLGTQQIPVPPIGVIELDLATLWSLGEFTVPTTGHDPLAAIDIPVPNEAWLVGITFYAQVVNSFATVTGAVRLSNRLAITIGS